MRTMLRRLLRLPMSLAVTTSALAGYALVPGRTDGGTAPLLLAVGVFLLASGCSVLNQVQERATDAMMARTRLRPIAAGRLSPAKGALFAALLQAAGLAAIASTESGSALLLGTLTALWYHAVYTPLKRRTPFALLAGSLCGALPPLIGWSAAGGAPTDPRIMLFASLMALWQVLHFWALTARHSEDYRRAGIPTLRLRLTAKQITRLTRTWLLALTAATPLVLSPDLVRTPLLRLAALPLLLWMLAEPPLERRAFRLHAYLGVVLLLIFCDNPLF